MNERKLSAHASVPRDTEGNRMATRGHALKTDLTPEEKLKAAYFHLARGVDQQILAEIFNVNRRRLSAAISEIKAATREERERNS